MVNTMKEHMSALFDDEAHAGDDARLFGALAADPALRARWQTWCVAGDALRGEARLEGADDFCARVMTALADEPTVLAPRRRRVTAPGWAVAASLAAVALGALVWVQQPVVEAPLQVAELVTPAVQFAAAERRADVQREYLFMHQAVSGGGPLPGGVQYARSSQDPLVGVR